MPVLQWLGREEALTAASRAVYRLLTEEERFSYGDPGTGNLIVQGDNLEALKALLPFYAGHVKRIRIDPPYNTGSAFEQYDDNKKHTIWLSMMYPRLEMLKQFLREDGSIWISIDDDESHYLKVICDEIFGRNNVVANVVWQKKHTRANDARYFSDNHDHIVCHARHKDTWRPRLLERAESSLKKYTNPDNDPRGVRASHPCHVKTPRKQCIYPIISPSGKECMPPKSRSWMTTKERMQELIKDKRIWFGAHGDDAPRSKKFLSEVKEGVVPLTIGTRDEVGDNQEAKKEIKALFPDDPFSTPKPERLIQRILALAAATGDYVLDSFLGSGTTAAVAHKMGRRYTGVETGEQAKTHCAARLKRVIDGEQGGVSRAAGWTGGSGFRFFTLGDAVFDDERRIQRDISFDQLAAHIYFTETKTPLNRRICRGHDAHSPFLGAHEGAAYALLYNGVAGDTRIDRGNVLTHATLNAILRAIDAAAQESGAAIAYRRLVVYGEATRLSRMSLANNNIIFKQTPYDIKAWR